MSDYKKIDMTIMPNGWRRTTYERTDGSKFYVALPKITYTNHGEPFAYGYDEEQETKTAESLRVQRKEGKANE